VTLVARVKSRSKNLEFMNSQTLKESGFSEPCLLKSISFLNLPFNKSSVFAVIDTTLTGKTTSDILYIGRSKRPSRRILGGYLSGYGGKSTRKINSELFDNGYIEKVAISWMVSDKPKTKQKELMDKFILEHGESPLWNASKKKTAKAPKKTSPPTKPKTKRTRVAKAAKPTPASKQAKPTPKTVAPTKAVVAAKKPAAESSSPVEASSTIQKPEP